MTLIPKGPIALASAFCLVSGPRAFGGADEATIHEIVAANCSVGQGKQLEPPGQSNPDRQSFVRALQATGVVVSINTTAGDGNDVIVVLDDSKPASKYVSSGGPLTIPDGFGPGVDLTFSPYLIPNPDFPAFANCANLSP